MEKSLVELLGLPDVDHVVYKSSPLTLALCQVKFARTLSVASASDVAPFQRAIQDDYPILAGGMVEVNIEVVPSGVRLPQGQPADRWQFADLDDNWKVILAPDFLAIETRDYGDFGSFLERLKRALAALMEHINPPLINRIGLRYINEIRLSGLPWSSVIRPELLGVLAVPPFAENLRQSFQELVFRYDQAYGINIQHGLFPVGTVVRPKPGVEVSDQPFYLLDLDAYWESPTQGGELPDIESICRRVKEFNRANYRLFRWCVAEEYVSRFGVLRYATD